MDLPQKSLPCVESVNFLAVIIIARSDRLAGSFLPVALEQLARERGVLWSDNTTPCVVKPDSGNRAASVVGLLVRAAVSETETDTNHQCVIPALGNMTTSSFALYTFSLAVFIQALALVSFSAVADHG